MISAADLDRADDAHRAIPGPHARHFPLADARRTQDEFVSLRAARLGDTVGGYKVAFTNPQAQAAVAADDYLVGTLLTRDFVPNGVTIDLEERFSPIFEVELLFRVRKPLGADATRQDVLASTEIAAGVEVPESRFDAWFGGTFPVLSLEEIVSDNGLSGLVIVGDVWVPASDLELSGSTAELVRDGVVVKSGSVAGVDPDPVAVVLWLAHSLGAAGRRLEAGDIVSSGTYTGTYPAGVGDYRASFSLPLGEISFTVRD